MKILALLFAAALAQAAPAPLKWGADSEGGAPFVFQHPRDPSVLAGCEVEIAREICRRIGRKDEFVHNTWEGLIPGLTRGDYDMALNAIEITPARAEVVDFSIPYYVTYEQLVVPEDNFDLTGLKDLKGHKVATYKGALAQDILEAQKGVKVVLYEAVEPAYRDLLNGRVEAVLLDHPLALYFGRPLKGLKLVGAPIARMEYGIAIRKSDKALKSQVNSALRSMIKDGKLREIWERWNLWNEPMAEYTGDLRPQVIQAGAWEDYLRSRGLQRGWKERLKEYIGYLPLLARGALTTLELSVLGMSLAIFVGLCLTLSRLYAPAPLRWLSQAYIELFRGTPLLIQLYVIFYGLPYFDIKLPPFAAAVLGLGLNYAAYEAEVYRAGLLSVPKGQMEAALSLGFSRGQALRHIILPQAIRISLPPLTNDFISILKDSSLVSVITMVELTKVYGQLASATYDWLGIGILTAMMYFFVGLPFVMLARWAERKFTPDARTPQAHR